jgi:uncharacterized protein DUF4198
MKNTRRSWYALLLALCVLAVPPARAHEYWLSPSVWRVGAGETVSFGALAGVGFVGERKLYSPERVVRLVARAARELDLTAVAVPGDSVWARFAAADAGGLLLAYQSDFATIMLESPDFDRYLADEGLDGPLAARRQRHDGRLGFERYRRCAKAWLAGGDAKRATATVGMPLEIVPLAAPGAEATLRVRVLRAGRPLAGALVRARRQPLGAGGRPLDPAARDSAVVSWSGRTDARGEARVALTQAGEWLISVVDMIPSRDPSAADWESTWASLTFARGLAAAAGAAPHAAGAAPHPAAPHAATAAR